MTGVAARQTDFSLESFSPDHLCLFEGSTFQMYFTLQSPHAAYRGDLAIVLGDGVTAAPD